MASLPDGIASRAEDPADLFRVGVLHRHVLVDGHGRAYACSLTGRRADGDNADRGLGLVGRADAAPRDKHVVQILRQ